MPANGVFVGVGVWVGVSSGEGAAVGVSSTRTRKRRAPTAVAVPDTVDAGVPDTDEVTVEAGVPDTDEVTVESGVAELDPVIVGVVVLLTGVLVGDCVGPYGSVLLSHWDVHVVYVPSSFVVCWVGSVSGYGMTDADTPSTATGRQDRVVHTPTGASDRVVRFIAPRVAFHPYPTTDLNALWCVA